MKINLPSLSEQQKLIFEESTKEAISILKENLKAPVFPGQDDIDESIYPNAHLLREREGWESPDPDIVGAYFRYFQAHFKDYDTDKKLADMLGISSDRRIREFKSGTRGVPYGIWRKFLVMTGRAPQDVIKVLAYMA